MSKEKNKYIPFLDSGHGKMILGKYQTEGKRSPDWDKGILYEGMFNNWVVNRLIEKLDREGIPYVNINPEYTDISLHERVQRAKYFSKKTNNTPYYFSVHANAGGGEGIEGFTSVGNTKSDIIASEFLFDLKNNLVGSNGTKIRMRFDFSDKDPDKEAQFYVLRKTKISAFLLECGFMDYKSDYYKLFSEQFITALVESIFNTMKNLYYEGV